MSWVCARCQSSVVLKRVESKALTGRMSREFTMMPAHCSNPDCVYFDERRLVFGWANVVEDTGSPGV